MAAESPAATRSSSRASSFERSPARTPLITIVGYVVGDRSSAGGVEADTADECPVGLGVAVEPVALDADVGCSAQQPAAVTAAPADGAR